MTERKCFVCDEPVAECMALTVAGDFVLAAEGLLPWSKVRERCPLCGEKELLEDTLALLRKCNLQSGP